MKWYAHRPVRLTRQLIADLLAAGWVAFWIWVATTAHDWVLELRAPGDGLVAAGGDIRDVFTNAAGKARDLPLVGDDLSGALGNGTKAGETLIGAGNTQIAVANGATTALTLSGDTVLNLNRFQIGFGVDSTPSVLIQGTSRINKTGAGWLSIGNSNNSQATVTVRRGGLRRHVSLERASDGWRIAGSPESS